MKHQCEINVGIYSVMFYEHAQPILNMADKF